MDKDVIVSNRVGKFQIAIGYAAGAIGLADQGVLHDQWKWGAPNHWRMRRFLLTWEVGWKPNSPHANFGGIAGSDKGRGRGQYFAKTGGAAGQIAGEQQPVVQLVSCALVDANTTAVRLCKSKLQLGEEPLAARDSKNHAAKLA